MPQPHASFVDSRDFARISRAIEFVEHHFRRQPRLAEIAARAGLSEFHFNRLFRRWAGLTPKQYLAFVTGSAARHELRSERPVLDVAYSVGLSGPSRLHDLLVTLDAMTPGELRAAGAGLVIRHGLTDSPFGTVHIATTPRGVCHLAFVEPGKEGASEAELSERWKGAALERDAQAARDTARRIWHPDAKGARLRVCAVGTPFQLKVWEALVKLGARSSTTYTEVADAIGHPSSVRAVGNAVAANPVGWLIPCHNVLRKDGQLGGYHWGEARKQAMQAWTALDRARTPEAASRL